MKDPFILKMLDVNVDHITRRDQEMLRDHIEDLSAHELMGHGWLCYVGDISENWTDGRWSEAFMGILHRARDLDCDYVRISDD